MTTGAEVNDEPRNERVQVHCRIKPLLKPEHHVQPETTNINSTFVTYGETEHENDEAVPFEIKCENHLVLETDDRREKKEYVFDSILQPDCSQAEIYQKVAFNIVQDVMAGFNGTILAYGQTSSGKTYTMLGPEKSSADTDVTPSTDEERGIIPRTLQDIFQRIDTIHSSNNSSSSIDMTVKVSYVQIYCERLVDLLSPDTPSTDLSIREDSKRGVYVEGAALTHVRSWQECLECLELGNTHRSTASTNMNAASSRSHAIFLLLLERREESSSASSSRVHVSQLCMVDLAGSERATASRRPTQMSELRSINLSLSALGNCVSALSLKRPHVPYRDSKLTRLLQFSLGRNAKTSLVLTCSSHAVNAHETSQTCEFGQRAMLVPVRAHLNVQPDYRLLYERFQSEVDTREDRIQTLELELEHQKAALEQELECHAQTQASVQSLELDVQALRVQRLAQTTTPDSSVQDDDITIETLRTEVQAQLAQAKVKCDTQVAAYKSASQHASEEWHHLTLELEHEKAAHLATLSDYRACRETLTRVEHETSERVAELLALQDEIRVESAKVHEHVATLKSVVVTRESEIERLRLKIKEDYVSRETIERMERLYEDTIAKITARVGSLESASNQESSKPATFAKQQPLPQRSKSQNKAMPVVGRVQPATRKSLVKSSSRLR